MTCGVYQCLCTITGRRYIGSAKKIELDRWPTHTRSLRLKEYKGTWQEDWSLYGVEAFEWSILEITSEKDRVAREQVWLDLYWPTGYNTNPVAGRPPSFYEQPGRVPGMLGKHPSGKNYSDARIRDNVRPPSFDELSQESQESVRTQKAATAIRRRDDMEERYQCKKCGSPIRYAKVRISGRYGCSRCNPNVSP